MLNTVYLNSRSLAFLGVERACNSSLLTRAFSTREGIIRNQKIFRIFTEIAKKHNLEISAINDQKIIRLTSKATKEVRFIHGCAMDINSAAAAKNCKDKAITSTILTELGIANIEHKLFQKTSSWAEIEAFSRLHHHEVVCKPKGESRGQDVIHVRSKYMLQTAVQELCNRYNDFCISPYVRFNYEYRAVVVNGSVEFIFQKKRPSLIGNGVFTVQELLADYLKKTPSWLLFNLQTIDLSQFILHSIPKKGELIPLKWKHNSRGTTSEILRKGDNTSSNLTDDSLRKINEIAIAAANAVGICFCAVDIAATSRGYLIMEINSAPGFAHLITEHGETAIGLLSQMYEKAICKMFNPA